MFAKPHWQWIKNKSFGKDGGEDVIEVPWKATVVYNVEQAEYIHSDITRTRNKRNNLLKGVTGIVGNWHFLQQPASSHALHKPGGTMQEPMSFQIKTVG